MCLTLINPNEKVKIAKEDIVVFKEVSFPFSSSFNLGKPFAKYQDYYWYAKKESSFLFKEKNRVHCGLHSYKYKTKNSLIWVIPKGAKYYENEFEYASNRLEFVEFPPQMVKNQGVQWNPKSPSFFKKLFNYINTYAKLHGF